MFHSHEWEGTEGVTVLCVLVLLQQATAELEGCISC